MLKMEYFYYINKIDETGSINKAAEELYLSQPYLSHVVKEIESLLKITLFKRSSKGVVLTDAGVEFLKYARQIIAIAEKMKNLKGKYAKSKNDLIIYSMPSFTMMDIYYQFIKKRSDALNTRWFEMPNNQVFDDFLQGRCNIGLHFMTQWEYNVKLPFLQENGVCFNVLVNEPLCAVFHKDNPLARQETVTLKQLEPLEFLVESILIKNIKVPLENNPLPGILKKRPSSPTFNNNRSMMYYLTQNPDCYCVGQKSLNLTNPFFKSKAIQYVPISDIDIRFLIGCLTLKDKPSSSIEKEFVSFLKCFFERYDWTRTAIL